MINLLESLLALAVNQTIPKIDLAINQLDRWTGLEPLTS